jgi:hypothetical protein
VLATSAGGLNAADKTPSEHDESLSPQYETKGAKYYGSYNMQQAW